MNEILAITQAAKALGVSPGTLREWEKNGLMRPSRTSGKHRRYDKSSIEQMRTNGPPRSGKSWHLRMVDGIEKKRKQENFAKYGAFVRDFKIWEPEDVATLISNSLLCQQYVDKVEPSTSMAMINQINEIIYKTILPYIAKVSAATNFTGLILYERLRESSGFTRLVEESEAIVCKHLYLDDIDSEVCPLFGAYAKNIKDIDKLIQYLEFEVLTDLIMNAGTLCRTGLSPESNQLKLKEVCEMIDKKVHWKFTKWAVMDVATFDSMKDSFDHADYIGSNNFGRCFYIKEIDCYCYPYEAFKKDMILVGCKPHPKHYGYSFQFYLPLVEIAGRSVSIYAKKLIREGSKYYGLISP